MRFRKRIMAAVLSALILCHGVCTPVYVFAKETNQIENNSPGEAARIKGRLLYSSDLKGRKLKPHYFDTSKFQMYSGWYTLRSIEGLDQNSIEVLIKIYNALIDHGYSEAMAAGACGNIWQESNFNTKAGDGGTGGYGIVQWRNERKAELLHYADSKGKDWSDLEIQIKFLIKELNTRYDNKMNYYLSKYGNTSTSEVTNVKLATEAFCAEMEGCRCFDRNGKLICADHNSECNFASDYKYYQHLSSRKRYANLIAQGINRYGSSHGEGGIYKGMDQSQIFNMIFGKSSKKEVVQTLSESQINGYMRRITLSNGVSVVINKAIADDMEYALEGILAEGFEIKKLGGYNYRGINIGGKFADVREKPSYHAFGLAVDINECENPQLVGAEEKVYKDASGIGFTEAIWDKIRSQYQPFKNKYALTTVEYNIMRSSGFLWGRDFQNAWPDIMHFSLGEVAVPDTRSWLSERLETENRGY